MPAHARTSARSKRAKSLVIAAILLGGAALHPEAAHAVAITQTLFAGPANSVTVNTGASSIVGVVNFSDTESDSNVNRGSFLSFDGFDSSLGTLDLVTWGFSGSQLVRGRASTTCAAFLIGIPGIPGICTTSATTTTDHTLFADVMDGVPGIELQSVVNNFQATASGSGILVCLIFNDCTTTRTTARNFDFEVVRSGGVLSPLTAYVDVPTVEVEVGSILTVRNVVNCTLSFALLSECFGEGEGSATSSFSVSLTYDFTPKSAAVPLPASVWIMAVGIAGLGATSLRRRKRLRTAVGSRTT